MQYNNTHKNKLIKLQGRNTCQTQQKPSPAIVNLDRPFTSPKDLMNVVAMCHSDILRVKSVK
jgi:hypothetical protein